MLKVDLHCHSNVSDGKLTPEVLAERACNNGVQLLSLTDHDELSGNVKAREVAEAMGVKYLNGVEISTYWKDSVDVAIHIVGLNVSLENDQLNTNLIRIRSLRHDRAKKIAFDLEKKLKITGVLEGAYKHADNPDLIGRAHFGAHLFELGYAKSLRDVFQHYLTPGKPGYVGYDWADYKDAINWIHGAGGVAVLAHPGRYRVGNSKLLELLGDFKNAGGEGIEVVTGSHSPDQYPVFATLAKRFGFKASVGSDFHSPDDHVELGHLPTLPDYCEPIWDLFDLS